MLTQIQIHVINYLISTSADISEMTKKILLFLVDQSEGLTKGVRFTIMPGNGYGRDEISAVGGLHQFFDNTLIEEWIKVMGNDVFCFNVSPGYYDRDGGYIDSATHRTFWLGEPFSDFTKDVSISRDKLMPTQIGETVPA